MKFNHGGNQNNLHYKQRMDSVLRWDTAIESGNNNGLIKTVRNANSGKPGMNLIAWIR